jgi:hypothetical protein
MNLSESPSITVRMAMPALEVMKISGATPKKDPLRISSAQVHGAELRQAKRNRV